MTEVLTQKEIELLMKAIAEGDRTDKVDKLKEPNPDEAGELFLLKYLTYFYSQEETDHPEVIIKHDDKDYKIKNVRYVEQITSTENTMKKTIVIEIKEK